MSRTNGRPHPPGRSAFASRLRQARIDAGHDTMEAAAHAVGIRSGVYWRHEKGKQGLTLEFVSLYARAFYRRSWLAGVRKPATKAQMRQPAGGALPLLR